MDKEENRERNRLYYQKNKERHKKLVNTYYHKNKDKIVKRLQKKCRNCGEMCFGTLCRACFTKRSGMSVKFVRKLRRINRLRQNGTEDMYQDT